MGISDQTGISVVIPAFNEQRTIADVIAQLENALKGYLHEIVVVDDGSLDLTGEIARELGARVITNDTTLGYGKSLLAGMRKSRLT